MPTFRVTVVETVVQYRSKVFRTKNAEMARALAEGQEWSERNDWIEGRSHAETSIEDISEIEDSREKNACPPQKNAIR